MGHLKIMLSGTILFNWYPTCTSSAYIVKYLYNGVKIVNLPLAVVEI